MFIEAWRGELSKAANEDGAISNSLTHFSQGHWATTCLQQSSFYSWSMIWNSRVLQKPEFYHELISPRVFLLDYVDLTITISSLGWWLDINEPPTRRHRQSRASHMIMGLTQDMPLLEACLWTIYLGERCSMQLPGAPQLPPCRGIPQTDHDSITTKAWQALQKWPASSGTRKYRAASVRRSCPQEGANLFFSNFKKCSPRA